MSPNELLRHTHRGRLHSVAAQFLGAEQGPVGQFYQLPRRHHRAGGGIADNLGLRAFYDALSVAGDPGSHVRELAQHDVRQILIISINSHAKPKTHWILERYAPSLRQMVHSVSADQISRYSVDTVALVRSSFEQMTKQLSTPQRPVTFDLGDEQVDRLIAAACEVLRESPEFQTFLGRGQGRGDGPERT